MLGNTAQIVRRPTAADIDFLVDNIREDDLAEVKAMGGKTVRQCLNETDLENTSWVWEHDGKVMCIFGVNPVENSDRVGAIWMLATKFFDDHFMIFASACKPILMDILKGFRYVFNYVYVENSKSIKWLSWLGFKIRQAEPIGVNGANFHRFEMWNEQCAIR